MCTTKVNSKRIKMYNTGSQVKVEKGLRMHFAAFNSLMDIYVNN